ncbi:MAG: hypothetical protein Aurels2KO_54480 [Aureliella sp.]
MRLTRIRNQRGLFGKCDRLQAADTGDGHTSDELLTLAAEKWTAELLQIACELTCRHGRADCD